MIAENELEEDVQFEPEASDQSNEHNLQVSQGDEVIQVEEEPEWIQIRQVPQQNSYPCRLSKASRAGKTTRSHLPASSPVMIDVELMVASGSKCSRIYDYIRDNSPYRVQMWDMYILISKTKKSGSNLTDEDHVAEVLVDFNFSADGNVVCIDGSSRGQTAVVLVSSQHMRKMYKRFPELLLMDCSHKTNRYNYQLCTLMIMDQFVDD
ncbi:hypothetical protein PC119_g17896 [Phytophthora cactorum]|nr:hypothetical protein PC111_g15162 [Phytophthora cactorum]KAG2996193.1 hypothetical protein PC119_g17896 [Phytophthora cactorum]